MVIRYVLNEISYAQCFPEPGLRYTIAMIATSVTR